MEIKECLIHTPANLWIILYLLAQYITNACAIWLMIKFMEDREGQLWPLPGSQLMVAAEEVDLGLDRWKEMV